MHKLILILPLVAIMFDVGLSATEHGFHVLERNKALTARAVLTSAFLVPAIAVVLIELFRLQSLDAIGLFLISVAAGPPVVPLAISAAKGDVSFGIGLSHLLAVVTIFTAPALTNLAAPLSHHLADAAHVDVVETVVTLILVELIPISIGMRIRRKNPPLAERLRRELLAVIYALIAAGLVFVVGKEIGHIKLIGVRGIVAGVLSGAASALLGFWMGGPHLSTRKTLALSSQARNIGLALALTSSAFPQRADLVAAVASFWLIRTLLNVVLGRLLASREEGRGSTPTPETHGGLRQRRA
jgi:BASS family bile acid:Na+ symporter